ncbi:hypothetical protein CPT_Slocum_026 [Serratia phage Slocum]|nr:hypothetical protein CPT_Slocum_026 [Serratia phage Slocum]
MPYIFVGVLGLVLGVLVVWMWFGMTRAGEEYQRHRQLNRELDDLRERMKRDNVPIL